MSGIKDLSSDVVKSVMCEWLPKSKLQKEVAADFVKVLERLESDPPKSSTVESWISNAKSGDTKTAKYLWDTKPRRQAFAEACERADELEDLESRLSCSSDSRPVAYVLATGPWRSVESLDVLVGELQRRGLDVKLYGDFGQCSIRLEQQRVREWETNGMIVSCSRGEETATLLRDYRCAAKPGAILGSIAGTNVPRWALVSMELGAEWEHDAEWLEGGKVHFRPESFAQTLRECGWVTRPPKPHPTQSEVGLTLTPVDPIEFYDSRADKGGRSPAYRESHGYANQARNPFHGVRHAQGDLAAALVEIAHGWPIEEVIQAREVEVEDLPAPLANLPAEVRSKYCLNWDERTMAALDLARELGVKTAMSMRAADEGRFHSSHKGAVRLPEPCATLVRALIRTLGMPELPKRAAPLYFGAPAEEREQLPPPLYGVSFLEADELSPEPAARSTGSPGLDLVRAALEGIGDPPCISSDEATRHVLERVHHLPLIRPAIDRVLSPSERTMQDPGAVLDKALSCPLVTLTWFAQQCPFSVNLGSHNEVTFNCAVAASVERSDHGDYRTQPERELRRVLIRTILRLKAARLHGVGQLVRDAQGENRLMLSDLRGMLFEVSAWAQPTDEAHPGVHALVQRKQNGRGVFPIVESQVRYREKIQTLSRFWLATSQSLIRIGASASGGLDWIPMPAAELEAIRADEEAEEEEEARRLDD